MGDYRTTTGEEKPLPRHQRKQRRVRWAVISGALVLMLAIAATLIRVPHVVRAQGYVTSDDYAEVRPAIAAKVTQILVHSGDTVAAGDLMVQCDDEEQHAAVKKAHSEAWKAEAELSRREAEIAQQKVAWEDEVRIVTLRERNAEAKLRRITELEKKGLAAGATVEDFRLQENVIQAELNALQKRDFSVFEQELAVLRHEVSGRQEMVAIAQAQLAQRRIVAPIAGQVLRYEFVPGEFITTDHVLYEVFGGERQILKLRVDERDAAHVQPGQRYRARVACYRGLKRIWFTGTVEMVRNVIQTDRLRTYRAVYCTFDAGERPVPPGTTANAKIYTGRQRLWAWLFAID